MIQPKTFDRLTTKAHNLEIILERQDHVSDIEKNMSEFNIGGKISTKFERADSTTTSFVYHTKFVSNTKLCSY